MNDIDSAVERKRLVAQLRAAIPYQGRSAIPFLCHQAADEIDRLSSELTRLRAIEAAGRAALQKIANGNFGKLDPAGDGGTYILTGHEYADCRRIAREALAAKPAGGAEQ